MAKPNAKKKAKTAEQSDDAAPKVTAKGADKWAKAVADGVPSDAAGTEADQAFAQQTADIPLDDLDLDVADVVDDEAGSDIADDDQIIDAVLVDDEEDTAEGAGVTAEGAGDTADGAGVTAEDAGVGGEESEAPADISVEDLVLDLERVTSERDQYLDASRRLQAEFENYKKQVGKREAEARERANDSLVGELLPVLDAFDGAVANGAEDVVPMRTSFLDALAKQGLERIDPADVAFDPNLHEAVMHEDADDTDGPVVAEVMRAGYVWKGRVLRPAMVRTRG